jgi:putative thioredoxin
MLQQAPTATAATDGLIKDTTTQTFVKDVIEESKRQPVLVDFWADWCNPCKQLTPVLEKVVKAAKGKVKLVKLNTDKHPAIPGQLGIQSLPTVFAFVNGQPVDGFMGNLPEGQVVAFLERVTKGKIGNEEKDVLAAADAALAKGDAASAADLYARQRGSAGRAGARLHQDRRDRAGQADARDGARGKSERSVGRGRARGA